ncbi:MAG: hypothetical protein ACK52I_00850 [Pseudomonadota bacterium]|jgi:hypothetical protein
MRIIERNTETSRTLEFLHDIHRAIIVEGDDMPRAVYTAMHYRLGQSTIAAAQRQGIIRRYGWRWDWCASKPTMKMADRVASEAQEVRRIYVKNLKRK